MNYWLVVGSPQNWRTAFKHGDIWGLKSTQRHFWESLAENDKLIFYATAPVAGIIGYGIARTKFKQDKPLWPDEIKQRKVIWPLRFEFDVEFCLAPDKWASEKVTSRDLWPRAGFQLLDQNLGKKLLSDLRKTGYAVLARQPSLIAEIPAEFVGIAGETEGVPISHEQLKEKLIEIGNLQNYIAEPEYQFDLGKLDVVWRRVVNSVPTYVFEIQVGGDIYHALVKLKHAFDLWNSNIFLVAPQEAKGKAQSLLAGSFHEINSRLKFIVLEQVEELYKRKKNYKDFERELGI